MKKKVCVFTGSRADYAHLRWVMQEIQDEPKLNLHTLVSGSHFLARLGSTWREIEESGFNIDTKIKLDLEDDSNLGIAVSLGQGVQLYSHALKNISPDILIVLGDRYEALAVATSAMLMQIPIAHIHGGETTEGAIDEAIRHSITKMAHVHFVATEEYRNRVVQLGENPSRVFNFGPPGLDRIHKLRQFSREELAIFLGTALNKHTFVVTYHPVTLDRKTSEYALAQLLQTLDLYPEATIICTKANADQGGKLINDQIQAFVDQNPATRTLVKTLGSEKYYSLLRLSSVVIGNSSSGIIEAPVLGIPTVNIGPRQKGRARSPSIIDCIESANEIEHAINTAISPTFQEIASRSVSPYGSGNAAKQIVKTLQSINIKHLIIKSFYNLQL